MYKRYTTYPHVLLIYSARPSNPLIRHDRFFLVQLPLLGELGGVYVSVRLEIESKRSEMVKHAMTVIYGCTPNIFRSIQLATELDNINETTKISEG